MKKTEKKCAIDKKETNCKKIVCCMDCEEKEAQSCGCGCDNVTNILYGSGCPYLIDNGK